MNINLEIPKELNALQNKGELRMLLVILYDLKKISSGKAAEILGVSKSDFLDILSEHKVQFLSPDTIEDLKKDISLA